MGPPGDAPAWLISQPAPRLLYVGALGTRVDVAQARAVAEAYPGGSLTFVGWWANEAHFEPLLDLPNVSFVTRRPRSEITGAIAAADAYLILHVRNRLTEAMSPLKLFEYLAGGAPVAAVDLPPIAAVEEERVFLVPAGGDIVPATARALEAGRSSEQERRAFLEAQFLAAADRPDPGARARALEADHEHQYQQQHEDGESDHRDDAQSPHLAWRARVRRSRRRGRPSAVPAARRSGWCGAPTLSGGQRRCSTGGSSPLGGIGQLVRRRRPAVGQRLGHGPRLGARPAP